MFFSGFNEPPIPFLKVYNYSENSLHVVTGSGTDSTAILDGLTVTGGNAETYPNEYGGGIYNYCGSPTLNKCTLTANFAGRYGGAMYNEQSSPTLVNSVFYGNSVIGLWDGCGGGIYNIHSNPTLINCTFERNWVYVYEWELGADGGGMSNAASSPKLTNCTFSYNWALFAGGMSNYHSDPTLTNCTFTGNASDSSAGGMSNHSSSPMLTNCTFSANYAHSQGGGMKNGGSSPMLTNCRFVGNFSGVGGGIYNTTYRRKCNPVLTNCVFVGNSATHFGGAMYNTALDIGECSPRLENCILSGNSAPEKGGGIYNYRQVNASLINCTFTGNSAPNGNALACDYYQPLYSSNVEITNCILWDGGNEIWNNNNSVITITYSDVQGSWPGEGNIDADPCFVKQGYWEPNCISGDDYYCTYDWIDGDYHLLPDSPCIDAGDPNYIAEPNETDLDGKLRVIGGRIDMGAYESPVPAEVRIAPRTINLSSEGKWITAFLWLPEDYNVADIDSNSVLLEDEIEAESLRVDEQQQVAIVRFNRSDAQSILNVGDVELTITGQLTDGTVFEATDVIRVIDKGGQKSAK
jgi:predicted outer membrane repeat protein